MSDDDLIKGPVIKVDMYSPARIDYQSVHELIKYGEERGLRLRKLGYSAGESVLHNYAIGYYEPNKPD